MRLHSVKIEGEENSTCKRVFVDGQEIKGVQRAMMFYDVKEVPTLYLEVTALNAEVDEPQADVIVGRESGQWEEYNPQNSDKSRIIRCTACGNSYIVSFQVPYDQWIRHKNYCYRCGARMLLRKMVNDDVST